MRPSVKLSMLIPLLGTMFYTAAGQPGAAQGLITDLIKLPLNAAGELIRTTGDVVNLTVTATGDVVDATGNVIRIGANTTGYILNPTTGVIIGTVDTAGHIIDASGRVLVGTPAAGFVVVERTSGAIIGTVDSTGHVVRAITPHGRVITRVIASGNVPAASAYLVDPASGSIRGILTADNRIVDMSGSAVTNNFNGYLVLDASTNVLRGTIDSNGRAVFLSYDTFPQTIQVAGVTGYIVDPLSGSFRGYIDPSGRLVDISGNVITTADSRYIVVDPTTHVVRGLIGSEGRVITRDISIPETYRKTTLITGGGGQPTTTTTTTTTTSGSTRTIEFPSTGIFLAVDPTTGAVRGTLDPVTRLLNGQPVPSRTVIINKATGEVLGISDTTGAIVDINAAPVDSAFLQELDNQRNVINRLIAEQSAKGTLSADVAANLKAALDKINAAEIQAQSTDTVFTYSEALPLAIDLRTLAKRLNTVVTVQEIVPVIGSHFVFIDGHIRLVDDITVRRFELDRRIADEFMAGRLTSTEVSSLRSQMEEIVRLDASYRAKGELTHADTKELYLKFDRVGVQLDHMIAGRKRSLGSR